ncbi:hypothetical protein [Aurantimonas endophytica]|uniref:Uncharacterized protein n=1 Tax=Aurantimonas endophytica TaxID=1522175 RepID=A0A7W6H9I5_9HYPH|nr:hypothetical protein [Aurantimonas endophytica]MBB4000982.1 hypothetical protein [Aurantimonas endophytica]MCO6403359.1 hypothetical protein [Aurantimonas endophytica]
MKRLRLFWLRLNGLTEWHPSHRGTEFCEGRYHPETGVWETRALTPEQQIDADWMTAIR